MLKPSVRLIASAHDRIGVPARKKPNMQKPEAIERSQEEKKEKN